MTPRRPTLLVVDDEPSMGALLQRFAQAEGFDVVAAGDGCQTLEWLRPGPRTWRLWTCACRRWMASSGTGLYSDE